MSSVYISEPVTNGKVLLHTTFGDLDIELWSQQAPLACRNFIQLSMEGEYDNTIFHRLIPNFIIQGGDPTGTGLGGECVFDEPFKDEFHSRLRFSRRGIVAMANDGANSNKSQFFITLGDTPDLNGKYTIFGKIVGNTIFNLITVNDLELGEDDRPLYPPSITTVEILHNPFDDIFPRHKEKKAAVEEPKKKRRKVGKNKSLLSFGEEEPEGETFAPKKMKSSISAKREELSLPTPEGEVGSEEAAKRARENYAKQKEASAASLKSRIKAIANQEDVPASSSSSSSSSSSRPRRPRSPSRRSPSPDRRSRSRSPSPRRRSPSPGRRSRSRSPSRSPSPRRSPSPPRFSTTFEGLSKEEREEGKRELGYKPRVKGKLKLKKMKKQEEPDPNASNLGSLSYVEKYKHRSRKRHANEEEVLGRVKQFRKEILVEKEEKEEREKKEGKKEFTPSENWIGEREEVEDDEGWMSHQLKFVQSRNVFTELEEDMYAVYDPRAKEKKKEKERRQERKEGGGRGDKTLERERNDRARDTRREREGQRKQMAMNG